MHYCCLHGLKINVKRYRVVAKNGTHTHIDEDMSFPTETEASLWALEYNLNSNQSLNFEIKEYWQNVSSD